MKKINKPFHNFRQRSSMRTFTRLKCVLRRLNEKYQVRINKTEGNYYKEILKSVLIKKVQQMHKKDFMTSYTLMTNSVPAGT